MKDKKVLVYGMGVSGKGLARLLKAEGVSMVLFDRNTKLDMEALKSELGLEGVKSIQGELSAADLEAVDIVALSPGVSINAPDIVAAKAAGKEVFGEIEIAFRIAKGRMAAITGTNGKTTTTALVGEIMKAAYPEVFVVGNIGASFAAAADKTSEESVIVAEISSFQLESIKTFHPNVTAVLNLTPDHLDRHGTFECYAKTKLLIASNQTPDEKCVINYDDEYLKELAKDITPEVVYFSRLSKLEKGAFLDGEDLMWADGTSATRVVGRREMNLLGDHNVENVLAAIAIGVSMGVDVKTIGDVIRAFKAVEHRIEYTCTRRGVSYYNDSKGTNTDAAAKAIESMEGPTVLIAGGYDKGLDFTDWIKGFNGKVKDMILIGQTAEKIRDTALACGFTSVHMVENLKVAVSLAAELAEPGDAVLLSPACASWGQFDNYEQRGRMFKDFARELPE